MSALRFASPLLLSLAALGCAPETDTPVRPEAAQTDARESPPIEQYGQVGLMLRGGDPGGGRQAFLDLKCTVCHRVTGEADFPEPLSNIQGPVLDATLGSRPEGYVATAIIAPSHSISINVSDAVKTEMSGVLSPMADYSAVMTVRQMLDLLAYLETIGD